MGNSAYKPLLNLKLFYYDLLWNILYISDIF